MIYAIITLRILDQLLTWLYGRQTEQMAAAKWAIGNGLAVYVGFCIVSTGLIVAACELSGLWLGDMERVYTYGLVTGVACFMLERNVMYLIQKNR